MNDFRKTFDFNGDGDISLQDAWVMFDRDGDGDVDLQDAWKMHDQNQDSDVDIEDVYVVLVHNILQQSILHCVSAAHGVSCVHLALQTWFCQFSFAN